MYCIVLYCITYGSHQIQEQVLCSLPETHLVGELGAEERHVGDRAGQGEGQGPVQTPRIEGHMTDPWHGSKGKSENKHNGVSSVD